jgi:hypothetical protein
VLLRDGHLDLPRRPTPIPKCYLLPRGCNRVWRNPDHFVNCSNFEQSLLKMMTRRKRWSTSAGSGWPQGQSLVVQVSGGARRAQAASTRQSRSNPNFGESRVDTIFRAGLSALLFFSGVIAQSDVLGDRQDQKPDNDSLKCHFLFPQPRNPTIRAVSPSAWTAARYSDSPRYRPATRWQR